MSEPFLYHLTSEDNWKEIQKTGLTPTIGPNSKIHEEPEPLLFLCDRKSIPYWYLSLRLPVCIQIAYKDIGDNERWAYSLYDEYTTKNSIKPDKLQRVLLPEITDEHMRELCIEYIWNISRNCASIARYYEKHYVPAKVIKRNLSVMFTVLKNLDYKVCTTKEIIDTLKKIGNAGDFSFTDKYKMTNQRLWSQLLHYDDNDELLAHREALYQFITNTFSPEILKTNTGGWCM